MRRDVLPQGLSMTKIADETSPPNPILDYPGYSLPDFFSTILGNLPNFALPDWGPLPPLRREQSPPPTTLPPPIEIDAPAEPQSPMASFPLYALLSHDMGKAL